jgi:hypothetical protein
MEQECTDTGIVGKCYSVSTEATSGEDLEVITSDICSRTLSISPSW